MGGGTKWTNESVITLGEGYAHCIANQILLANSSASSTLSNQLDLEYFHIYTFFLMSSEMLHYSAKVVYLYLLYYTGFSKQQNV